jgi:exopolyphosphatase/guanosine-5'-triphosphate,3'-diphosphate pyrophosphatase
MGAAIDVGSNSVHLLVAQVATDGLRPVLDESALLGIGPIVDREGRLPPAAIAATLEALHGYVGRAAGLGARSTVLVGTEPIRRASNRSVLQADALRVTGRPLHVLSHDAEAALTLLGVAGGRPPTGSLLVLDVGGGSSEMVLAMPERDHVVGVLPTGSARLTAAIVEHDPPTWSEIDALRAEARRLVAALPDGTPQRGVLVGGSSTNLLRVSPEVPPRVSPEVAPRVSPDSLPGASLAPRTAGIIDSGTLERIFEVLASRTADELVASTAINAMRAPQLAAGAALVEAVLDRYGLGLWEVSAASLRDGAILAAEQMGEDWLDHLPALVRSGT